MRGVRGPVEHGTRATYQNHSCRCDECRAAQAAYQLLFKRRADPAQAPHGTTTGYSSWNCRCVPCREAHAARMRVWRARRGMSPNYRCVECQDGHHGHQCRGPADGCRCRCRPMLGLEGPFEFGDPTAFGWDVGDPDNDQQGQVA